MPARRELTMRQLRQMLRLHHDGVSEREIARTLGVARSTIQDNLGRARTAGISWPPPAEWSDEVLEGRPFARSGIKPGRRRRSEPDWVTLARELKRPGVNLMVTTVRETLKFACIKVNIIARRRELSTRSRAHD
jgi:transposase